jgi:hypothetical protein
MEAVQRQGTAPVGALLLQYSLPAIAGFLAAALYQFVDRIVVGRGVGTEAMAAVTCAYPLTMLALGAGLWLGTGTGNQVSTFLGQRRTEDARMALARPRGRALFRIIPDYVALAKRSPPRSLWIPFYGWGCQDATLPSTGDRGLDIQRSRNSSESGYRSGLRQPRRRCQAALGSESLQSVW